MSGDKKDTKMEGSRVFHKYCIDNHLEMGALREDRRQQNFHIKL